MPRRVVREDVLGMADFEWTRETQRELHLTRAQVKELESGKIIRTPHKGGTEWYLVDEPEPEPEPEVLRHRVNCPTCGGKGYLEVSSTRGKIA